MFGISAVRKTFDFVKKRYGSGQHLNFIAREVKRDEKCVKRSFMTCATLSDKAQRETKLWTVPLGDGMCYRIRKYADGKYEVRSGKRELSWVKMTVIRKENIQVRRGRAEGAIIVEFQDGLKSHKFNTKPLESQDHEFSGTAHRKTPHCSGHDETRAGSDSDTVFEPISPPPCDDASSELCAKRVSQFDTLPITRSETPHSINGDPESDFVDLGGTHANETPVEIQNSARRDSDSSINLDDLFNNVKDKGSVNAKDSGSVVLNE